MWQGSAFVLWLLLSVLALAESYLLLLTVASLLYRHRRAEPRTARTRFAILVAAHNEQATIGTALSSLAQIDYPAELFDVHVVADNCSDGTAEAARAFDSPGVKVHQRHEPEHPGKGRALCWLLERIGSGYDAFVVLDADCAVSGNLLAAFDARLQEGDTIVQAWYRVADQLQVLRRIERSDVPLARIARWPFGARSALAITGNIDALTLLECVFRARSSLSKRP